VTVAVEVPTARARLRPCASPAAPSQTAGAFRLLPGPDPGPDAAAAAIAAAAATGASAVPEKGSI
jgi:hypothetical protein